MAVFLDIDLVVFFLFLIVTLLLGIRSTAGVKTMETYALGGRNFSDAALISTIVATYVSGGTFFTTLSKTYSDGLFYLFASLGIGLSFILIAFVFIPRMENFLGNISVASLMGKWYGDGVQVIVAVAGTIGSVGSVAVQFRAFGNIMEYFFNIPIFPAIILSGIIVTIYSAFGGIKAVTLTDMLQFAAFGFAIPFVVVSIWEQLYTIDDFSFRKALEVPKFNFAHVFNIHEPEFWSTIPLFLYFLVPGLSPMMCQRIFMGNNIKQVIRVFAISGVILIIFKLILAWLPFLIYSVNPNLKSGQLLSFIIDHYAQPGLKGLVLVGVVAMSMSSADSMINSSAVLFGHDICAKFNIFRKFSILSLSKMFSIFLGIGGIFLSLQFEDLLSILLAVNSIYMPVVSAPLIITVFGFKTTTRCVLIGMVAALLTVAIWNIIGIKIDVIVFAMVVNILFLMGSHYLLKEPGGWTKNDIESKNKKEDGILYQVIKFVKFIKGVKIIALCKKYSPTNDLMYVAFGCYCILFGIGNMYSTDIVLIRDNNVVKCIFQIIVSTGVIIAVYPIWPISISQSIKKMIISLWWYLAVFYVLVFFAFFFVLLSNFRPLQFSLFTINVIITMLLVGWKVGISILMLGLYFGAKFYKYCFGVENLNWTIGSPQFFIVYLVLILSVIILVFIKPMQDNYNADKEASDDLDKKIISYGSRINQQKYESFKRNSVSQTILKYMTQNLRVPIGNVVNFSGRIKDILSKEHDDKELKLLVEDMYNNSNRLSSTVVNLLNLAALNIDQVDLTKNIANFSKLVKERIDFCKDVYLGEKDLTFDVDIEEDIIFAIDENYMCQVIDNLLINSITYSDHGTINIILKSKNDGVEFVIKDEGIGIDEGELDSIFDLFVVGSRTSNKACGRGLGLALCRSVINAHNGKIVAKNSDKGAIFEFFIKN